MFLAPTTVSPSVIVSDFHSVSVTKRRDDIAAEMGVDKIRFVKETMKLDFGCWKAKFLNRGEKTTFMLYVVPVLISWGLETMVH